MTSLKGTKLLPARGTLLLSQSGDLSQRLPPSFRKTDPGNTKRELEFSFGFTLLSFNSVFSPPHRIPLLTMAVGTGTNVLVTWLLAKAQLLEHKLTSEQLNSRALFSVPGPDALSFADSRRVCVIVTPEMTHFQNAASSLFLRNI